jgi:hypothetical protein
MDEKRDTLLHVHRNAIPPAAETQPNLETPSYEERMLFDRLVVDGIVPSSDVASMLKDVEAILEARRRLFGVGR